MRLQYDGKYAMHRVEDAVNVFYDRFYPLLKAL